MEGLMSRVADLTFEYEKNHRAMDFTRWAKSMMLAKGDPLQARAHFEAQFPKAKNLDVIKSAVAAGTTTDSAWGAPLSPLNALGEAFVEMIRPRTVLGQMRGIRKVPFRITFPRQTVTSLAAWVGQGRPIPVAKMGFERDTLMQSKLAAICVTTNEIAYSSDPDALRLVEADLKASIVNASDASFLDPTLDEVPDVSPASITFGADSLASTGSSAAQIEADIAALFAKVTTDLTDPYLVMRSSTARYLATLRASGQRVFPNIGAKGGDIWGVPVLITSAMPTVTAGSPPAETSYIVLLDAAEILLADDGAEIDASDQATIQMDDAPTNPPVAATVFTSLWQMNLTGVRAIRFINWKRRRPGAVAYISGVAY
ncbi:MAG: phage major capsid protein [Micropepsaceae bacterium]